VITKAARPCSLEVRYLYRSRNAGRATEQAWTTFVTTASTDAHGTWNAAQHTERKVRRMREIATKVTIARARHSLSLAELRTGSDAYADYAALPPSRGGRDSHDHANDKLDTDTAHVVASRADEHEARAAIEDLYLGDEHDSTGPPSLYARAPRLTDHGDPPT
jgi:hypothetical protein